MVMQMGNPLPKSAVALGRKLVKRVLPSGGQLRRATGLSRDQFQDGIRCLTNAGLVRSAEFGSLVRPVRRYWLSQEGLNHFGASEEEKTWHGDDAIGTLILYDMPKVEAVHAVADRYATGGRTISAVHFVEEWPLCAVVEITVPGEGRPALLVICWASTMDTQSELFHRLEAIPEAMLQRTLTPDDQCFPAAMAVVGHSEWSVARALTMASVVLRKWIPPATSRPGTTVTTYGTCPTGGRPRTASLPGRLPGSFHPYRCCDQCRTRGGWEIRESTGSFPGSYGRVARGRSRWNSLRWWVTSPWAQSANTEPCQARLPEGSRRKSGSGS